AGLAVAPQVAERLVALQLAAIKLRISQAARSGDAAAARLHFAKAEALVTELPAGPTLTDELSELQELRSRIEQRDFAMTARYSEKFARDRVNSRKDGTMRFMAAQEHDRRAQKLASITAMNIGGALGNASRLQPGPTTRSGVTLFSEHIARAGHKPATLEVVIGDITDQAVDAIVNSSNRGLFGTSGVDGAIHRKAGPALKAATQAVAPINFGEAVFTSGYDLPAQYIIHTATPPWGTTGKELQQLAQCYEASLALAERLGVKSVALPAIGTGAYGYPLEEATKRAATVVSFWLARGSFETVRFVVMDAKVGQVYLHEISAWR
ncbi:MAG TPA: macro domain-containing protein, partial [Trueperaceae bacterium]|nr:macro domain-containing protein [Trueperaceae bacterium]